LGPNWLPGEGKRKMLSLYRKGQAMLGTE